MYISSRLYNRPFFNYRTVSKTWLLRRNISSEKKDSWLWNSQMCTDNLIYHLYSTMSNLLIIFYILWINIILCLPCSNLTHLTIWEIFTLSYVYYYFYYSVKHCKQGTKCRVQKHFWRLFWLITVTVNLKDTIRLTLH